jgi:hypothetical protein
MDFRFPESFSPINPVLRGHTFRSVVSVSYIESCVKGNAVTGAFPAAPSSPHLPFPLAASHSDWTNSPKVWSLCLVGARPASPSITSLPHSTLSAVLARRTPLPRLLFLPQVEVASAFARFHLRRKRTRSLPDGAEIAAPAARGTKGVPRSRRRAHYPAGFFHPTVAASLPVLSDGDPSRRGQVPPHVGQ